MELRKTEIMNVIKKDPTKYSASNIQLKVLLMKRPPRLVGKTRDGSTGKYNIEKLLKSDSSSIPPLVGPKLQPASNGGMKAFIFDGPKFRGARQKRIRRYAESHSLPELSAGEFIVPNTSEVPVLPVIPEERRRRRAAPCVDSKEKFNIAYIVPPVRLPNDSVTRQSNDILTPRRQQTEDLIFGRGKVLGGEKGRALPIQYQECKYEIQNQLIQAMKKYDA